MEKSVPKLWKSGLTPPPPLILSKKSITFGHKKSVQKLWIGRDPPPPYGKIPLKSSISYADGFPKSSRYCCTVQKLVLKKVKNLDISDPEQTRVSYNIHKN